MKTKTYKQQLIDRITQIILQLDKQHLYKDATHLRIIRQKAKLFHGRHFVPTRFPSKEYLSIYLSIKSFIN